MRADLKTRLSTLAEDSRYDLSCSCSSNNPDEHRKRTKDHSSWLYPVQLAGGGVGIVMKTLMSNACSSDCKYCPLRHNGIANRCSMTPDEVATAFMDQLQRQWLLGIFLSSGIIGTPDHTMELLTDAAEILRKKHHFRGYIHLKIIPGASHAAITKALSLASAVSLNIETPGAKYFKQLSNYKKFDTDIVEPLKFIAANTAKGTPRAKVKCTTQFIVGAADEKDSEIIKYTGAFYDHLKFKRVYFSAFQPPPTHDLILDDGSGSLRLDREHRLYQADFLLRKYKFAADELVFNETGNLDLSVDPKKRWADSHPEFYPVRVNTATRSELLRIPGIGPTYVDRILKKRREAKISSWTEIGLCGQSALKPIGYAVFS